MKNSKHKIHARPSDLSSQNMTRLLKPCRKQGGQEWRWALESILFSLAVYLGALPTVAGAQALSCPPGQLKSLQCFIQLFIDFNIQLLLPISFSLGFLYFMWRGTMYIFHAGSEEGKSEGRRVLFWGVISLFLMITVWGLVAIFQDDLIGEPNPTSVPILYRDKH